MRTLLLATCWWSVLYCAAIGAEIGKYLTTVQFKDLVGWHKDDHAAAFSSWLLSCREIIDHGRSFPRKPLYAGERTDWQDLCSTALQLQGKADRRTAKAFFETHFVPVRVDDPKNPQGLFTGYFEPEVPGDRRRTRHYNVPIYARPSDLVAFNAAQRKATGLSYGRLDDKTPRPYPTRETIENGALAGQGLEIVWLKYWADAFFLHIQGSGRVRMPDGSVMRLGYAAKSGLPYTSIGAVLIRRGIIAREQMSMQSIRKWMAENPDAARELMWQNQSFIFFRELALKDPDLGPLGAQQIQLTPLRSLAVDRRYWAFGTPFWLETSLPDGAGGTDHKFNQLMIAQDTGSAIKNRIRGDVFFGAGDTAAELAGHMKSPGRLYALLPRSVVSRLGLPE